VTRPAILALAFVLAAAPAGAIVTRDCARPGADCTIAETARQAHVFVGAIANQHQTPDERALLARHFNATTPENEMKWGVIAPTVGDYDFAPADEVADFAAANDLRLRGHTLVWGRLQLPQDLAADVGGSVDPAARLRDRMGAHFETMLGRYGDRVRLWDVVNEPLDVFTGAYDANLFFQTLGAGYVAEAFTRAHALAPDAELFLNEFFLTLPGEKADALVALVKSLRQAGVPIHGVGVQAHFFPGLPLVDPAAIKALAQALGDTGVAVELTEVDVSIWHFRDDPDPLARQAEFYDAVVSACLDVPACRAITLWGLDDGGTWLDGFAPFDAFAPNAPTLFDAGLAQKPAYFAVRDAVARRAPSFLAHAQALATGFHDAFEGGGLRPAARGRRGRAQIRRIRRALAMTTRRIERERYPRACDALARARATLATTTGPSSPDVRLAAALLAGELRCDEP
jgi:endo-1,4-beta-xylanase